MIWDRKGKVKEPEIKYEMISFDDGEECNFVGE